MEIPFEGYIRVTPCFPGYAQTIDEVNKISKCDSIVRLDSNRIIFNTYLNHNTSNNDISSGNLYKFDDIFLHGHCENSFVLIQTLEKAFYAVTHGELANILYVSSCLPNVYINQYEKIVSTRSFPCSAVTTLFGIDSGIFSLLSKYINKNSVTETNKWNRDEEIRERKLISCTVEAYTIDSYSKDITLDCKEAKTFLLNKQTLPLDSVDEKLQYCLKGILTPICITAKIVIAQNNGICISTGELRIGILPFVGYRHQLIEPVGSTILDNNIKEVINMNSNNCNKMSKISKTSVTLADIIKGNRCSYSGCATTINNINGSLNSIAQTYCDPNNFTAHLKKNDSLKCPRNDRSLLKCDAQRILKKNPETDEMYIEYGNNMLNSKIGLNRKFESYENNQLLGTKRELVKSMYLNLEALCHLLSCLEMFSANSTAFIPINSSLFTKFFTGMFRCYLHNHSYNSPDCNKTVNKASVFGAKLGYGVVNTILSEVYSIPIYIDNTIILDSDNNKTLKMTAFEMVTKKILNITALFKLLSKTGLKSSTKMCHRCFLKPIVENNLYMNPASIDFNCYSTEVEALLDSRKENSVSCGEKADKQSFETHKKCNCNFCKYNVPQLCQNNLDKSDTKLHKCEEVILHKQNAQCLDFSMMQRQEELFKEIEKLKLHLNKEKKYENVVALSDIHKIICDKLDNGDKNSIVPKYTNNEAPSVCIEKETKEVVDLQKRLNDLEKREQELINEKQKLRMEMRAISSYSQSPTIE